ncbi:PRC-barrel domain-containing protein [Cribrihabitans neustonicus]|uniref:PRC-barrel domain-containing protein n=1 Tax=Cribrihabitans neustonicus TaxID=1429085 RepID=UPI003B5AB81F
MTALKTKARILASVTAAALIAGPALAASSDLSADVSQEAAPAGSLQTEGNLQGAVEGQGAMAEAEANAGTDITAEPGSTSYEGGTTAEADAATDVETGLADSSAAAGADLDLANMTAGELTGKKVLSADGNDVGEIDYVIKQGGKLAGVVGVGGFLGMGEHTVAIPLEDFKLIEDEQLQLSAQTEANLKAMAEVDESQISPLPEDEKLAKHL